MHYVRLEDIKVKEWGFSMYGGYYAHVEIEETDYWFHAQHVYSLKEKIWEETFRTIILPRCKRVDY